VDISLGGGMIIVGIVVNESSCIEKWLKSMKKCPSCNTKAKKADIRNIYTSNITVIDNHELEFTMKQLKKEQRERSRAESERAKAVLEAKLLSDEVQKLRKENEDLKM
jgi:hypothetical protein